MRSGSTWHRRHPMHRLLQGEVGSGKTVVAMADPADRCAGRLPGRRDGAHRGARRAALPGDRAIARTRGSSRRRRERARSSEWTASSATGDGDAVRMALLTGSRSPPTSGPGRSKQVAIAEARSTWWWGPTPSSRRGCLRSARDRGGRRAASLRGPPASGLKDKAADIAARCADHDGHPDPPDPVDDSVRRSRGVGDRRDCRPGASTIDTMRRPRSTIGPVYGSHPDRGRQKGVRRSWSAPWSRTATSWRSPRRPPSSSASRGCSPT